MKDGLSDRKPGVHVAVGELVASWFDMAMVEVSKMEERTWNGDDGRIMKGLIHLLSWLVLVKLLLWMRCCLSLTIRPDIPDVFTFEGPSADHLPSVKCISEFSSRS